MSRRGYGIALAAAVAALVTSMGLTAAYALGHHEGGSFGPAAVRQAEGPGFGPGDGRGGFGPGMGGGMGMGRWGDNGGDAAVSQSQAQSLVQAWVAKNEPGATVDAGFQMPMGYVFTVTKDNAVVAHVMVNDDTGALVVRTATGTTLTPSGTA